MVVNFYRKPSLLVVKAVFRLVKNHFSHLSDISGREINFLLKWRRFYNEFLIPANGNKFSVLQKQYCFIQSFAEDFKILFQLVGTNFLASRS